MVGNPERKQKSMDMQKSAAINPAPSTSFTSYHCSASKCEGFNYSQQNRSLIDSKRDTHATNTPPHHTQPAFKSLSRLQLFTAIDCKIDFHSQLHGKFNLSSHRNHLSVTTSTTQTQGCHAPTNLHRLLNSAA